MPEGANHCKIIVPSPSLFSLSFLLVLLFWYDDPSFGSRDQRREYAADSEMGGRTPFVEARKWNR